MSGPLADAWAKFNWAKKHSQEVKAKIIAWTKPQGHGQTFDVECEEYASEYAPRRRVLIYRIGQTRLGIPQDLSLIIGDAIFNFRASLEYLAWQLVRHGTMPNPKVPENVGWPIYDMEAGFLKNIDRKLPGLLKKHRALVEATQPCRGKPGKVHPLAVLNSLSRYDKHRKILVVVAAHKEYKVSNPIGNFRVENVIMPSPPALLMQGAELVRFIGERTDDSEAEVPVRFMGAVGIAFPNGMWVLDALAHIEQAVGNILANFDPLL